MFVLLLFPLICFAPVITKKQVNAEINEILAGKQIIESVKNRLGQDIDGNFPIYSPIKVNEIKKISDLYGWRKFHPVTKRLSFHHGIDFAIPTGTNILATANGIVSKSGWKSGYGNQITINHGNSYKTRYAHLSKLLVNPGDTVKCGNIIGISGNTGISTGPHLHYEVVKNGRTIDPMRLLVNESSKKNIKLYLESLAKLEKIAWLN